MSCLSFVALAPEDAKAVAPGGVNDSTAINRERPKTERRGGFALVMNSSYGYASFVGYPNFASDVGKPEFRASTGPALGTNFSLFLGGALRDWLVTGAGIITNTTYLGKVRGLQSALVFHLDAFPLYYKGGHFRDLGLSVDGGVGFSIIEDPDNNDEEVANGGSLSTVGIGVFYEPWQFWRCSFGPTLNYVYSHSQSLDSHLVLGGIRFSLYSGQPKKSKKAKTKSTAALNSWSF
ncbi:MAG: hypothetical protein MK135_00230 [Polyangiaceae bacterium]|nr:hypothetical protein [Polyangiaceae bacterium]